MNYKDKDPHFLISGLITTAFFLCSLLYAMSSYSLDLDIGLQYTETRHPSNGIWYQEEFGHSIHNGSPGFHIGMRYKGWLAGYRFLGTVESDAFASSSDENYAQWRAGEAEIWPLAHWEGKGKIRGVYVGYEHDLNDWFFVKGGLWYHENYWRMTVTDWRPLENGTYGEARDIQVHGNQHRGSYFIGAGIKLKNLSISYELWDIEGRHRFKPMYIGISQSINLTYRF